MAIHPELRAVMRQATYQPYTGQDGAGNNTYGAARQVWCHRDGASRSMNTSAGDSGTTRTTQTSRTTLIADYVAPGVAPRGKITLYDGTEFTIVDVETVDDENGPYYQELSCSINMER